LNICDKTQKTEKKNLKKYIADIIKFNNKIQNTREIFNIYAAGKKKYYQPEFNNLKMNKQHNLLPIKNGLIIDLKTLEIRQRTKDDIFNFEAETSYIKPELWTETDKKNLYDFIGNFCMDDPEYLEYMNIKLGSYLCGDIDRTIDIYHGHGKNGKSTLFKVLDLILTPNFSTGINKAVICQDKTSHKRNKEASNHTSAIMPINGKRLITFNELEENDYIISGITKAIASGDKIEARECFGRNTIHIYPHAHAAITTNIFFQYDINDTALRDRFNYMECGARFLKPEDLIAEKENGQYDPEKYKYYEANENLLKLYEKHGRTINIFFSWLCLGCKIYYDKKDIGIPRPERVKQYAREKVLENDTIKIWINEDCETLTAAEFDNLTPTNQKEYTTSLNDLHNKFVEWARATNNLTGITRPMFAKRIKALYKADREARGVVYLGIKIR
jgi:phage/plasmid-associated DNA primase